MTAGKKPCSRPPVDDSSAAAPVVWLVTRKKRSRSSKRSNCWFSAYPCIFLILRSTHPTCPLLFPTGNCPLHLLAHLALGSLAVLLHLILGGTTPVQKNDLHPLVQPRGNSAGGKGMIEYR